MANLRSVSITNPQYINAIVRCIQSFLHREQIELSHINAWGSDVCNKLASFSINGKLIRGSLVCYVSEAYTHGLTNTAVKTAAAVELFHSSLLIHDDIIDNDSYRRGQKTIFEQYRSFDNISSKMKTADFGKQMGICAGDIGFFLAIKLLQEIHNTEISALCVNELIKVAIAQMQDIYFGYIQTPVKQKEIENVYLYKTARYSFSLPCMLGGILAKINKTEIDKLEHLGEIMGLLFQIKDDELNLFGDISTTGKPIGSDIRENKKTFYYYWLFQKVTQTEKQKLLQIFGNKHMTPDELMYVKNCICSYHIQNSIRKKIHTLNKNAQNIISLLAIPDEYRKGLSKLLQFITERNG